MDSIYDTLTGSPVDETPLSLQEEDLSLSSTEPDIDFSVADTLTGGKGNDILSSSDGNDIMLIVGGNGTLADGLDDDIGGDENDILTGGGGYDILIGGLGDDILNLDAAQDTFRYASGDGIDTVNLFSSGVAGGFMSFEGIQFVDARRSFGNDPHGYFGIALPPGEETQTLSGHSSETGSGTDYLLG